MGIRSESDRVVGVVLAQSLSADARASKSGDQLSTEVPSGARVAANIERPFIQHHELDMDLAMSRIVEPHATDTAWLICQHFELDEIIRGVEESAVDPVCLRIRQPFDLRDAADSLSLPVGLTLALGQDLSGDIDTRGPGEEQDGHPNRKLARPV